MLWLLDRVTISVSQCSRPQVEGLEVSAELHRSMSQGSLSEDLKQVRTKSGQQISLKANKLNPFAGVYASIIQCNICLHTSHSYQLEYSISVPLRPTITNLEPLLAKHFQTEHISEFTCLSCSLVLFLKQNTTDSASTSDQKKAIAFITRVYE